jgi:molybdopterin-guanine dinucleotide biosynthesis protein A
MRGAVLAGGAASRYGGLPKGLLPVGGRRVLDRVVDTLSQVLGEPPMLVANAPEAATWRPGLICLPDRRPGAGSLGGIYTAVVAAEPEPVLCVAWDMPFVTAPLLQAIIDASREFDALLPESGGRRGVEPLCAVYGPACRPAIEQALERQDLRAIAFHDSVRVGTLPLDRVRACGDPDELFFNINRPEDLQRAEALWRRRG